MASAHATFRFYWKLNDFPPPVAAQRAHRSARAPRPPSTRYLVEAIPSEQGAGVFEVHQIPSPMSGAHIWRT
ncbi:MAG: hypothetical protein ABI520_09105 [Caldimonas sp.]